MLPRDFCDPPESFGDPHAKSRRWDVPGQSQLAEFRGAVVQHAIAISVRRYKNTRGTTQDDLGRLDGRPQAKDKWNARLNGRSGLNMRDIAVLVRHLPGALPTEAHVRRLLEIAEFKVGPPPGWTEKDT